MADLEERVSRLEELLDHLVAIARDHPMGRAILKRLGLL